MTGVLPASQGDVSSAESKQRRVAVATQPASDKPPAVGVERQGVVSELFLTNLPQAAFTAAHVVGLPWKTGRFSGQAFALQPDGTLRCPARQSLLAHQRRREANGSLRVVYAASIRSCHPCPVRQQCQWQGNVTRKPRQVSILLHPLIVGSQPLLWRDWSRRRQRRACLSQRSQHLQLPIGQALCVSQDTSLHFFPVRNGRIIVWNALSERLACNARAVGYQRLLGVCPHPADGLRLAAIAISVFQGRLGLADAARAGNGLRLRQGCGLAHR